MSNLLKSKFLLGVLVVVAVFAVVGFVTPSKAAADCSITSTLRVGSTGAQVVCLQTALGGLTADGNFGPKTKAAVMAWQTKEGLEADGVFGPKSNAVWVSNAGNSASFPAGCNSTVGFSPSTGLPCNGPVNGNLPAGCTSTSGYSPTTGMLCSATSNLPAGCTSTAGFSPTTGVSCSTGGSTVITTGGAGDLNINVTTNDIESSAPESTLTNVVAFKGEATGSDIAVNNVKVAFVLKTPAGATSSTRLDHYASEVDVYMGSTKVGSALVSGFTKDGTIYSTTIPISGAIVRVGSANKQTFSVAVLPLASIDTGDAGSIWTASVTSVRYTDGTGLTLSQDPSGGVNPVTENFTFDKITTSGDLKLTVTEGSSNPDATNIMVSDSASTSGILMNQFTLKPTGADMTMTALGINETTTVDTGPHIAQNLILKINGDQVAEIDTLAVGAGGPTADVFTLDNDYNMTAGQTYTFAIYAKVNEIGTGTFHQGDSLTVSYNKTGTDIETTLGGSNVSSKLTGSSIGNAQTFFSQGINASNFTSSVAASAADPITGKITKTYSIQYQLTAFGDTYYVPKIAVQNLALAPVLGVADVATAITAPVSNGLGFSLMTSAGAESDAGAAVSPSSISSPDASTVGAYFSIPDGTTRTFRVTIQLVTGAPAGYYHIQLNQVLYDLDTTPNNNGVNAAAVYTMAPAQNFATDDSYVN